MMTPVPQKHIGGKESNQRDLITPQVTIVKKTDIISEMLSLLIILSLTFATKGTTTF